MKNDPKLTAYVLGELSEDEANEIRNKIDADIDLQNEVGEIQLVAEKLRNFMQNEPLRIQTPPKIDKPSKFRWTQLAVCAVILAFVAALLIPATQNARSTARTQLKVEKIKELDVLADMAESAAKNAVLPMDGEASAELHEDQDRVKEIVTGKKSEILEEKEKEVDMMVIPGPPVDAKKIAVPNQSTVYLGGDHLLSRPYTYYGTSEVVGMADPGVFSENLDIPVNADSYDRSGTEEFAPILENPFLTPQKSPFSTFSIDVDTASYSLMRRMVNEGRLPPKDSVRLEEYVNYFNYDYAPPKDEKPFATHVEIANCPWNTNHLVAKIGIKGMEINREDRPALNLVFLIDVSGSMSGSNRLPLVIRSLTELVEMLEDKDRIAIVTYAGSAGVALPSVSGAEKRAILDVIGSLQAGGSTAGAEGIQTAYEVAKKNFRENGQNRVILCTDGDFNVGISDTDALESFITGQAKSGVFLTVLGFGMGNYKDNKLETLANKGNGNYGYIDSIAEARKLLVENLAGTMITIAKDVKIQVDFNPVRVAAYRLLGYENRKLQDRDFNDDTKDAGEIGAGHTVTAMYEIVPTGVNIPNESPVSRYSDAAEETQPEVITEGGKHANEMMFVKLRYKKPDADNSELIEYPVDFDVSKKNVMSRDLEFACGVALFAMLLKESGYTGTGNWTTVKELAGNSSDQKERQEFRSLVDRISGIKKNL